MEPVLGKAEDQEMQIEHHVPHAASEQMGSKKTPKKTTKEAPSSQVSARLNPVLQEPFNAVLEDEGHTMDRTQVINALIRLGLDSMGGDVEKLIAAHVKMQDEAARGPKKK
jgi:hypothetical protein